jgi:uncharacterized membrane protein YdbT with pleckstrin-like domain
MGAMGLPRNLLGTDETEVLHLRTHAKVLAVPVIVLLVTAVAAGFIIAWTPASWQPWAGIIEAVVVVALVVFGVMVPFLTWLTTTYTFTDRRIITRRGIVNQTGHDLPLTRINNVAYERSLTDRMFGCGTLILTTAAEQPVVLNDIPDVERVHVVMTELLFGRDRAEAAGPVAQPPDAGE